MLDFLPAQAEPRREAEELIRTTQAIGAALGIVPLLAPSVLLDDRAAVVIVTALALPVEIFFVLAYWNARRGYRYFSASWSLLVSLLIVGAGITALLHLNGSTTTPVASLYVVLIMMGAFFSARTGWASLLIAVVLYSGLLACESLGLLPYAPLVPEKRVIGAMPGDAFKAAATVNFVNVSAFILSLYMARVIRRHREAVDRARTELAESNQKLVAMDEAKNRFLGIVSHDLRTPITSIKAFAEIIEDEAGAMAAEDERTYARTIASESDRLHRLVTDLLDLDKMEAGKMEWELRVQPITPVLENAAHVFRAAAAEKGVALNTEWPEAAPEVAIDADRLAQLIANLLSNAIKFTPAGGTVTLAARDTDEGVAIAVSDTGPGIPPDALETLFDRFTQAESGKHAGGGTGLGLAIAREIAHAHGGDLTVESAVGTGSTFRCVLLRPKSG